MIAQLGILVSCLVTAILCLCVLWAVVFWAVDSIWAKRREREQRDFERQLGADLEQLDRWCSYEFPVVEDMCRYLRTRDQTIDSFREELRRKHGKKNLARVK